jgi:hypothetical protein
MKLEQQITTAALAGRAGQRDFVDSLSRHWAGLISSVDTLLAAVADLTRGATRATARDGVHTTVSAEIGTAFGADSDWQKRAALGHGVGGASKNSQHRPRNSAAYSSCSASRSRSASTEHNRRSLERRCPPDPSDSKIPGQHPTPRN